VITDDRALTLARLGLCAAVGQVARGGLELLGVSAPDAMERQASRETDRSEDGQREAM
jgi:arginyl-tRNA synthetase